jgi:hypothetical protein
MDIRQSLRCQFVEWAALCQVSTVDARRFVISQPECSRIKKGGKFSALSFAIQFV